MFPSPTALPAAAKINPNEPLKLLLLLCSIRPPDFSNFMFNIIDDVISLCKLLIYSDKSLKKFDIFLTH